MFGTAVDFTLFTLELGRKFLMKKGLIIRKKLRIKNQFVGKRSTTDTLKDFNFQKQNAPRINVLIELLKV